MLRDDYGIVKGEFTASIGIRDSNEAEFFAVVFALEYPCSINGYWRRRSLLNQTLKMY